MTDLLRDGVTVVAVSLGLVFFTAGTIGLLRFPDLQSRLHALTKADNVGLGLVAVGLLAQATSVGSALKLLLVWLLALAAGATVGPLLAAPVPGETRADEARADDLGAEDSRG